jgi:hypothetical protein
MRLHFTSFEILRSVNYARDSEARCTIEYCAPFRPHHKARTAADLAS